MSKYFIYRCYGAKYDFWFTGVTILGYMCQRWVFRIHVRFMRWVESCSGIWLSKRHRLTRYRSVGAASGNHAFGRLWNLIWGAGAFSNACADQWHFPMFKWRRRRGRCRSLYSWGAVLSFGRSSYGAVACEFDRDVAVQFALLRHKSGYRSAGIGRQEFGARSKRFFLCGVPEDPGLDYVVLGEN